MLAVYRTFSLQNRNSFLKTIGFLQLQSLKAVEKVFTFSIWSAFKYSIF